jgi:hypothetical protein
LRTGQSVRLAFDRHTGSMRGADYADLFGGQSQLICIKR